MHTPVARAERQQTSPRPRYRVCPHCGLAVSSYWRRDYCKHCYRTFSTGKYDHAR